MLDVLRDAKNVKEVAPRVFLDQSTFDKITYEIQNVHVLKGVRNILIFRNGKDVGKYSA